MGCAVHVKHENKEPILKKKEIHLTAPLAFFVFKLALQFVDVSL